MRTEKEERRREEKRGEERRRGTGTVRVFLFRSDFSLGEEKRKRDYFVSRVKKSR